MKSDSKIFNKPYARTAGIVYLLYFITAILAQIFSKTDTRYIVTNLISCGFYITLTMLLYILFNPVNKNISMLAAFCSLFGCFSTILYVIKADKLYINPLIFFGPYCILIGYLIYQSSFLPHFLGILLITAGVGWLVILTPLESYVSLYIKIFGFISEVVLMLWLIIKGVNIQKWHVQNNQ